MNRVGIKKRQAMPIQKNAKANAAERARRIVDNAKEKNSRRGRSAKSAWKTVKDY